MPLLGICLGMQLLFEKSFEYGEHEGLGFIQGEVCPLEPDLTDKSLKVPQIGWNALHIVKDDPLFQYIREGEYVYYVHSYYGKNCTESTLATSEYSIPVTGAVRAGKVYGTQFHPEKERRHRPAHPESVCGTVKGFRIGSASLCQCQRKNYFWFVFCRALRGAPKHAFTGEVAAESGVCGCRPCGRRKVEAISDHKKEFFDAVISSH